MKFTPLLLACTLALATGAHAQSARTTTATPNTGPDNVQAPTQLDGEKGKQAVRKAGDATKRAYNRLRGKTEQARQDVREDRRDQASRTARRDDSRATSAGMDRSRANAPSTEQDRRARMDDAYANYQTQQQKR